MSLYVIDVEADGISPASGSMVCFGAVMVSDMSTTFYGKTAPITDTWNPEALAISGFTRNDHKNFDDPKVVMQNFANWVNETKENNAVFISDNPAFDWQWINYYFDLYNIKNPFGYSARRIGDLYCGLQRDGNLNKEWKKKYRKTKHTHNPVDDAKGNAEALHAFKKLGLKIKF